MGTILFEHTMDWGGHAFVDYFIFKIGESFADKDLSDFIGHVQSFELDSRIIDLMKKLNNALTTRTNSRASKRSRKSDASSSGSKGSYQSSSKSSSKENIPLNVHAAKINVQMHIPSY